MPAQFCSVHRLNYHPRYFDQCPLCIHSDPESAVTRLSAAVSNLHSDVYWSHLYGSRELSDLAYKAEDLAKDIEISLAGIREKANDAARRLHGLAP